MHGQVGCGKLSGGHELEVVLTYVAQVRGAAFEEREDGLAHWGDVSAGIFKWWAGLPVSGVEGGGQAGAGARTAC